MENCSPGKKSLLFAFNYSTAVSTIQRKKLCSISTLQISLAFSEAINHFAVRRAALCGQYGLSLTAQKCFDDGWQSSVSGSCLLTSVRGGNVSELVGMPEQSNCEGVENAKPMLRGVSRDGASLPFASKLPHAPASSAKHLQILRSSGCVSRKGRGISWLWPHAPPHPCTWKEVLLLFNINLNWRA